MRGMKTEDSAADITNVEDTTQNTTVEQARHRKQSDQSYIPPGYVLFKNSDNGGTSSTLSVPKFDPKKNNHLFKNKTVVGKYTSHLVSS